MPNSSHLFSPPSSPRQDDLTNISPPLPGGSLAPSLAFARVMRCPQCQATLPYDGTNPPPSLFEIDLARALCTGELPDATEDETRRAFADLVAKFETVVSPPDWHVRVRLFGTCA